MARIELERVARLGDIGHATIVITLKAGSMRPGASYINFLRKYLRGRAYIIGEDKSELSTSINLMCSDVRFWERKFQATAEALYEIHYQTCVKNYREAIKMAFDIVNVASEYIVTMAGEPLEPFALMCLAPDSGVTFMERELQKCWCMVESKYCTSKTKEDKYRIVQMHKNDWENFAINDLNIPEKLIQKLKSKFGRGQTKMKLKMLLLWRNKHGQQGLPKEELVQCAEDFLNRKLNIDVTNQTFTDVCRLIVTAIPDEKWMRFARLELALTEKEISNVRAKYSEFTEEQKYQMLRLFLCGNEDFSGDSDDASQDSYIIGREY